MVLRPHSVLSPVSRRYPELGGTYLYCPIPSAALGFLSCEKNLAARLACLIHAANVHSEPGSNPSILLYFVDTSKEVFRSIWCDSRSNEPLSIMNRHSFKGRRSFLNEQQRFFSHCMILTLPDCQRSSLTFASAKLAHKSRKAIGHEW